MPMPATDAELVARAKRSDPHALATIYERYSAAIYRYIYYRVNDPELAEDIRADVFLRMLEGFDRYEDRGWPISAWLYRIAHDRTVDAVRRRSVRKQVPLEAWNSVGEGLEGVVYAQLDHEELHRMIERLTDDQRHVIQMRFLQEMSVQEVADVIGRTPGAVKALQHRGLPMLARHLEHSYTADSLNERLIPSI